MKTIISISVLLVTLLCSCNIYNPDPHSLNNIINACEGHAIVAAKGINNGHFADTRYILLIKDTKTNKTYEYFGAKYEVNIGDTLK